MTTSGRRKLDNRRLDYTLKKRHGTKAKRPKTLRCLWCKEKLTVKPRGRLADYCSASCRQAAYVKRKYQRPRAVEALATDLAHRKVREWLRREIWLLLREAGVVASPEPPPIPRSARSRPSF